VPGTDGRTSLGKNSLESQAVKALTSWGRPQPLKPRGGHPDVNDRKKGPRGARIEMRHPSVENRTDVPRRAVDDKGPPPIHRRNQDGRKLSSLFGKVGEGGS